MATPAKFPSEVATRIYDILVDNKLTIVGEDGMVCYEDQNLIPVVPTVCVAAGPTSRALARAMGPHGGVENDHECYIILYYDAVQDNQEAKLASEQLGEQICQLLDTNPQLERAGDGGIVIHGYVTNIDVGYSIRNRGTPMYAVRLTWNGKTKTMLGA